MMMLYIHRSQGDRIWRHLMLKRGPLHYTCIFHKYECFLNFKVSSPQMACTPTEPTEYPIRQP
jgi:hypothetical protein